MKSDVKIPNLLPSTLVQISRNTKKALLVM